MSQYSYNDPFKKERGEMLMKQIEREYKSGFYMDAIKGIEYNFPEKLEEYKQKVLDDYGKIGMEHITKFSNGKEYVYSNDIYAGEGSGVPEKPATVKSIKFEELYCKIKIIPDMRYGAREGTTYEGFDGLEGSKIPNGDLESRGSQKIPNEYIISLIKEVQSQREEINKLKEALIEAMKAVLNQGEKLGS